MALRETLTQLVAHFFLEQPAKNAGLEKMQHTLRQNAEKILARMQNSQDNASNTKIAHHIITIERWGQNRLRVALGEKNFLPDQSKDYAPDNKFDLKELAALFISTRQETLALAAQVSSHTPKVPHNQLGPLSAAAWLRYLNLHSDMESKKIR